ncbi:MAG: helix-turn-helix transcriptional regulator [Xanthomonadales bacterium]|jgi:DNA-binding transcriptional ArsR family regulator|nr:helix-turn-helix transcriptional regulator [Xanthomonadales bacterium]
MELQIAIDSLAALAHDSRLRAFRLLVQAGPEGLPVGDIRDALDIPGATLSSHLNVLRHAGLVEDQREGRVIRCRANFTAMNALMAYLLENCCSGAGCAPATLGALGTACTPPGPPSQRSKK